MRGFPLLRILSVAAVLLLLGVPVWMLTRERVEGVQEVQSVERDVVEDFNVVLTCSAPAHLSVAAATHPIQASGGVARRFEARLAMSRARPEDLVVAAVFDSAEAAQALRAEVRVGGRVVADKTFWGGGEIRDVVGMEVP